MKSKPMLVLLVLLLAGGAVALYRTGLVNPPPLTAEPLPMPGEIQGTATARTVAAPAAPGEAVLPKASANPLTNTVPASASPWSKPYITAANSEKGKTPPGYKFSSNPQAKALAKYDVNGDGVLDENEKAALQNHLRQEFEPLRQKLLAQYDKNGDGVLDEGEQQAGRQAELAKLEKLKASLLPKYDVNRNGLIDPEEQTSIQRDGQDFLQRVKGDLLAKYDANANGTLDPEERATIKAVSEQVRSETMKRYDVNGDGKLDETEAAKMKSDLQNRKTQPR